jgi:hypothetical protein
MNASEKNQKLQNALSVQFGIELSAEDARTLRRAALTLRRWHEGECGGGMRASAAVAIRWHLG